MVNIMMAKGKDFPDVNDINDCHMDINQIRIWQFHIK